MPKTNYEIVRDALIKAGIYFGEDVLYDDKDYICGHCIYLPQELQFFEITEYDKLLNQ